MREREGRKEKNREWEREWYTLGCSIENDVERVVLSCQLDSRSIALGHLALSSSLPIYLSRVYITPSPPKIALLLGH